MVWRSTYDIVLNESGGSGIAAGGKAAPAKKPSKRKKARKK
jgi:hypothetical protein